MGWLNVVLIKEFLTLRCEIDLNYIDLHPSNIETLGWQLEEPLVINLEIEEVRLLNSIEERELDLMDFAKMWDRKAVKYSCTNGSSNKSFGCQDYMTKVFQTYIEDCLINTDSQEEEKLQLLPSLSKKSSSGIWSRLFGKQKVDDHKLAQLTELGFSLKVAKKALKQTKNDFDKALDVLKDYDINGESSVMSNKKYDLAETEN
jgi:UBA/TS-N domain